MRFLLLLAAVLSVGSAFRAESCTSAIISAEASLSGRPILWKHRDTSAGHNFVARVDGDSTAYGYVALFNGCDRLLEQAWMGMNDVGFAVMNTASYNLAPDTASLKDREGFLMTRALRECRSVDDFEALLMRMPKPLGVQANFGVIDADGNGAFFETDDYDYVKYDLADADSGVLIRTNFSFSGSDKGGYGYIRYDNAEDLLAADIARGTVTAASLTEGVSRSFYHSLLGYDAMDGGDEWVVDQDFVPRRTSVASIAIEGLLPGEPVEAMVMWTALGYPPCSHIEPVFIDDVPQGFAPVGEDFLSPMCSEAQQRRGEVFPLSRGNGGCYVNLDVLRPIDEEQRALALEAYAKGAAERERRIVAAAKGGSIYD